MSTKINISYKDKEYTLEYSREAVRQIEQLGFVIGQVEDKPFTMIPILFYGAFIKNHKISKKHTDEIMDHIPNFYDGEGILPILVEMYAETISSLTNKKIEDEGNAVSWKVMKG